MAEPWKPGDFCTRCNNDGWVICRCGGDLCVCPNNGEVECPRCNGLSPDGFNDEFDRDYEQMTNPTPPTGKAMTARRLTRKHDAIERLQAALNSPVSVMGGESFEFRVEDVKTVLAELDRLTKPIEDAEVAGSIVRLRLYGDPSNSIRTTYDYQAACTKAAALIDRLARENERLLCLAENKSAAANELMRQFDTAEARTERLVEEMRGWLLTIAAGRLGSMGGERDTYCPQINKERVDAALAALNEPKAGTE